VRVYDRHTAKLVGETVAAAVRDCPFSVGSEESVTSKASSAAIASWLKKLVEGAGG
jgi:hypothetical protein